MTDMPRPRPPHLHKEVTRHDRTVWYVRIGKGPRTRLRAAYGTDEFKAEYQAAIAGDPLPAPEKAKGGSMQWLYDRYRETGAWTTLSNATRRQRENIFHHVMQAIGHESFKAVTKKSITANRDRRSKTPAQARNFLDAMRGLFRWALEADHVAIDPTAGVTNPKRKKGTGFPAWTEDDVEKFEARWPIGTKERVWLDVLLYTGLRRGDAVQVGWPHVWNGAITLKTEKSGETVTVTIPVLPILKATLDAGPCGKETFIAGTSGKALTKESFGNYFREAASQAGVKKSAHGVRKIGATRAANNGATVSELEALFGWQGGGMAALYTRNADRVRLAKQAVHKLQGQSIPAPSNVVRARSRKR